MKRGRGFLLVIIFLLFGIFPSCKKPSAKWEAIIKKSDGITVIKNPSFPRLPEMKITFEEELTIGTAEGNENDMFVSQVFINADEEGLIYITDRERRTVKIYDPNGQYLFSIGRPGQGPGEFQDISRVIFDSEGRICLLDSSIQRISFFRRDGTFLNAKRTPLKIDMLRMNPQGFYIGRIPDSIKLKNAKSWDYVYGLFDPQFNLVKEFMRFPQEAWWTTKGKSLTQVLANYLSSIAFRPRVHFDIDGKGFLYFGYPEEYVIRVYSPDGRLVKLIRREHEPRLIERKDKERFMENQIGELGSKIPAGEVRNIFSHISYPQYKPAYERFAVMENGWIFVVVDSAESNSVLVDIFDQEGQYIAAFETNIPTEELFFKNGKAYAVATIDGYKFIKRYRYTVSEIGDTL